MSEDQPAKRGCWVTHPWNAWVYSGGTSPTDCLERAEIARTQKIETLRKEIEAIKAMSLVVEYAEAVADEDYCDA